MFFADSNFSASQFGTITLLNADWATGESGIYACDLGPGSEIRSVRYSDTDTGERWSWPLRNQLFAGPPDLLHFLAAGP